ncbi:MAG TPA: hypothetical protein EYH14_02665 [Euryarchaeota archaeon]|nr:hypothetical protein [Euryarchaeota archaeon]
MGVLSVLVSIMSVALGVLLSAFVSALIIYAVLHLLPKPSGLVKKYFAGAAYLLFFLWLAHFAYFYDYYSCVRIPDVPNYEFECVGDPLGISLALSFSATVSMAPYILVFYSVAFFVYYKMNLKSDFLRLYVATITFMTVMLLWFIVFPWALERYLQQFY